jgi:hypothetical protein
MIWIISWEGRNIESEKSAVDGDDVPATESEVDVEKIRKVIWLLGCLPLVMIKCELIEFSLGLIILIQRGPLDS